MLPTKPKLIIEPTGERYSIYQNDDGGTRRELAFQIGQMNAATRVSFLRSCIDEMNRIEFRRKDGQLWTKSRLRPGTLGQSDVEIYWDVALLLLRGLPIEFVMRAAESHRKSPAPNNPSDIQSACRFQ
jgi:hypothetical protein